MDRRLGWFIAIGLLLALLTAGFVSRFASSEPDGLERVAIDEGFADSATDHPLDDSPLADYAVEGFEDGDASTGLAGAIGVVITATAVTVMLWGIRKFTVGRRQPD